MQRQLLLLIGAAFMINLICSCDTRESEEPGLLVPLTVKDDPTLSSIQVNGTILHLQAFGDPNDPLIVIIHGGPGIDSRSSLNMQTLAEQGYYVVFYDQRGMGLSQRHNAEVYSIQIMIDDLKAVIDHYQSPGQKVYLLGHSWGAMLATGFVNEETHPVDGLILIEPGGFNWEDTKDYVEDSRDLKLFGEATNDAVYLDQFLTGSDHNTLDYKEGQRMAISFASGNKVGNTAPVPIWRYGAVAEKALFDYAEDHPFDFTTNLQQFNTKTLFVYSELNEAYGQAYAEELASNFVNVQLAEIMDVGHEIPFFGWTSLEPVILAYLEEMN